MSEDREMPEFAVVYEDIEGPGWLKVDFAKDIDEAYEKAKEVFGAIYKLLELPKDEWDNDDI